MVDRPREEGVSMATCALNPGRGRVPVPFTSRARAGGEGNCTVDTQGVGSAVAHTCGANPLWSEAANDPWSSLPLHVPLLAVSSTVVTATGGLTTVKLEESTGLRRRTLVVELPDLFIGSWRLLDWWARPAQNAELLLEPARRDDCFCEDSESSPSPPMLAELGAAWRLLSSLLRNGTPAMVIRGGARNTSGEAFGAPASPGAQTDRRCSGDA